MNIQNAQKIVDQVIRDTTHCCCKMAQRLNDGEFDANGNSQIVREDINFIYDWLEYARDTRDALNEGALPGVCGVDELADFNSRKAQKICDILREHSNTLITKLEALV